MPFNRPVESAAERRKRLLETLCERRHDTRLRLAEEYHVSERTIRRDIEIISTYAPLYTEPGKYGGIFVMDGYYLHKSYLSETQESTLNKILLLSSQGENIRLSDHEIADIRDILKKYTVPKTKKEKVRI